MEDTGTSVGAGSGGVAATSLVPSDGGDSDGGRDDALPVLPGWAANFFYYYYYLFNLLFPMISVGASRIR